MSDSEQVREIVGLILWWAEGTKKRRDRRWDDLWIYTVEVTNTDPRVLRIFLDFLRKDIHINEDKLKAQIQIHAGDDQEALEQYWATNLSIPIENFNKTIIRPKGNKPGKSNGTCKVRYNSKELYEKLEKKLEEVLELCNNAAR